jgi:hypothetical protein
MPGIRRGSGILPQQHPQELALFKRHDSNQHEVREAEAVQKG